MLARTHARTKRTNVKLLSLRNKVIRRAVDIAHVNTHGLGMDASNWRGLRRGIHPNNISAFAATETTQKREREREGGEREGE